MKLSSLKSVCASPSGATTVTVTKYRAIQVALDPARLRDMDELILAEEIEGCVVKAVADFSHESSRIVSSGAVVPPKTLLIDLDRWRAELVTELESIEVVATSRDGLVEVVLCGEVDLMVTIRHNALRRTDITVPVLTREINDAIERALAEYSAAAVHVRRALSEKLLEGAR